MYTCRYRLIPGIRYFCLFGLISLLAENRWRVPKGINPQTYAPADQFATIGWEDFV